MSNGLSDEQARRLIRRFRSRAELFEPDSPAHNVAWRCAEDVEEMVEGDE